MKYKHTIHNKERSQALLKNVQPIFIHSYFRTGSTYVFSVFRRSHSDYWCYQEPIHEVVLYTLNNPEDLITKHSDNIASIYRHPRLELPYYFELNQIRNHWKELISKSIIYDDYFDKDGNEGLVNYFSSLIINAKGRPVIQECRTANRIGVIKNKLKGVHLYLWRNPWDQWWSYKVTSYFDTTNLVILNAKIHPKAISLLRQEIGFVEYHSEDISDEFNYFDSHRLSSQQSYLVFYLLWSLALIEGIANADLLLNIDALSDSQTCRDNIQNQLLQLGIVDVDFSDCKVPQAFYVASDRAFFTALEERVHGILLISGYSQTMIDQLLTLRRSNEPKLLSSPPMGIPAEQLLSNCAKTREIILRLETENYNRLTHIYKQLRTKELEALKNKEIITRNELDRVEYIRLQQELTECNLDLTLNLQTKQQELSKQNFDIEELLRLQARLSKEKEEQINNYYDQLHALHQEYTNREHNLTTRLISKQQELFDRQLEFENIYQNFDDKLSSLNSTILTLRHNQQLMSRQHSMVIAAKQDELNHILQSNTLLESRLTNLIQSVQQIRIAQQDIIKNIHASLSWRLTAPFRKIGAFFLSSRRRKNSPLFFEHPEFPPVNVPEFPISESSHYQHANTPFPVASPSIEIGAASSLRELMELQDHAFITCAYLTILGRAPDPEGLSYYLNRIRMGIQKIDILSQLRHSKEGKSCRFIHKQEK